MQGSRYNPRYEARSGSVGSFWAAKAIHAAEFAIRNGVDADSESERTRWLRLRPSDPELLEEVLAQRKEDAMYKAVAHEAYMSALRDLHEVYPEIVCCEYFEIGGCAHTRPCPACGGRLGAWPWVVRTDLCCECEYAYEERAEWCRGKHDSEACDMLNAENTMHFRKARLGKYGA